jgi:hypothetical protein
MFRYAAYAVLILAMLFVVTVALFRTADDRNTNAFPSPGGANTRRYGGYIGIILLMLFAAAATAFFGTADDHHTNIKYLLWKHHIWHDEKSLGMRYLNVDRDFVRSLHGKTKAEVEWWFPELNPAPENGMYDKYYPPIIHDPGFYWINHTLWGILFENGRVKEIRSFEGG